MWQPWKCVCVFLGALLCTFDINKFGSFCRWIDNFIYCWQVLTFHGSNCRKHSELSANSQKFLIAFVLYICFIGPKLQLRNFQDLQLVKIPTRHSGATPPAISSCLPQLKYYFMIYRTHITIQMPVIILDELHYGFLKFLAACCFLCCFCVESVSFSSSSS